VEIKKRWGWLIVALAVAAAAGVAGGTAALVATLRTSDNRLGVRPTNTVLVAVTDLARLEVTEVHVEKVVDVSDRQSVAFDLLEGEDAMLLVAAGSAVIGVDLEKVRPEDVTFDPATGVARIALPPPEVLSSRLDPDNTYVYRRDTSWLATRNEHLEGRARKEALAAIERAANDPNVMGRARRQTERQLTSLLTRMGGVRRVEISWRGPA